MSFQAALSFCGMDYIGPSARIERGPQDDES